MKQRLAICLILMLTLGLSAFAQNTVTVSGKVVDQTGAPLSGAGVVVKGTTTGVITDLDGNYSIKVQDNATLVFSFIGYISQETAVGGRGLINCTLEEDTTTLDDVVVVGYATMKKRDLVGAVDQVGSEVIGNRANSNLTRSLQGEIAGLNITVSDGKPTHGGSVNVRGTGSIGAGGSSLVLIDGVEGDLESINPQDVASVSVLKDASSTAVYGARGAFGVILVTTKNAQKGRPVINYSGSVSINRRTVIPDGIYDSNEWLDWWITCYNGYYNGSKALLNHIDSKAPYSEDIYNEILRRKNDPSLSKVEESTAVSNFGYAYYDCHDWMSEFYRDYHTSTEHNLSVSGGNENADYYISGRYFGSDGVYKVGNENYKKYQLRAKGTLKVRPWLRITNNMSASIDKNYIPRSQNGNGVMRYMQHCLQPMAPLRNPDGSWTPAAGISGYAAMYEGNNYIQDNYLYLREKADVQIDIVKDVLKINADYSFNYTGRNKTLVQNMVEYSKEPGVFIQESTSAGDGLTVTNYDTRYQAVNAYATWSPKLKWDHTLNVLLGYNVEWTNYKQLESKRVGFTSTKPSFALMDGEASITDKGCYDWAYMGAFFRINYNIKSRYLFEVSGRYDGSSKFPTTQKWGFFPSGSFGWRLSEEPWMQWSRTAVDNAKIRVSAGSMGNGNVAPYKYTSEMALVKATDFVMAGGLPTYTSAASIVPNSLTWETATTYDVGIDLDFLKSRLSASFDYYWRNTTNLYTVGETLPPVFGADAPKGNNASLLTRGWELSLQWRDEVSLGGKPFSYSIKGTLWDSRAFVTKFNGNDGKSLGTIANLIGNMGQPDYYEGMELGEMWGYTVEGLFKDWDDIKNSAEQKYKQTVDDTNYPGQVKFADLDDSGKVDYGNLTVDDHGDWKIIGNSLPRFQYGLNFSANWNGIGLSLFFQGVGKRDWYPGKDCGYFWGKYSRPFFYFIPTIHRLTNPDMPQFDADGNCTNWDTAYWPRPTTYMANGDTNQRTIMNAPNTRYMQNAAFLRLKNVQIDYSFPAKICKAISISGLKIFANVENAFTITPLHKYGPNLDPEGIWGGDTDFASPEINGNSYPMFMVATFGLNVTF